MGFSRIGPTIEYFNQVRGYFDVECTFIQPDVNPAGSISGRAQQLLDAIQGQVPAEELDRGRVVHIVAHSMGGLDARFLISQRGLGKSAWIASLATLSTPHQGTPIADLVTGADVLRLPDIASFATLPGQTIANIMQALGNPVSLPLLPIPTPMSMFEALRDLGNYVKNLVGTPPAAFRDLTLAATRDFNQTHDSLEGIPLLCFAGDSSPNRTMNRALYATWAILNCRTGMNDGMVPASSASGWPGAGDIEVRSVPADHFEEVGWASAFDGFPPARHYDISELYGAINVWQRALAPGQRG
jgi:triacylglycerol lipase